MAGSEGEEEEEEAEESRAGQTCSWSKAPRTLSPEQDVSLSRGAAEMLPPSPRRSWRGGGPGRWVGVPVGCQQLRGVHPGLQMRLGQLSEMLLVQVMCLSAPGILQRWGT